MKDGGSSNRHRPTHSSARSEVRWASSIDFSIALIFFIYGVPTRRCYLLGGLGGPLSISPGPSRLFSQCLPFLHSVTGTQQTQMSPY